MLPVRALCYAGVVLMILHLVSLAVLAQPSRARERTPPLAASQQGAQVYTDMTRFMENRLQKLRAIVQRARAAQQKIRADNSLGQTSGQPKSIQAWKDIERRATAMMRQIKQTLALKRQQAQKPRVNKNITLTRIDGLQERMATHRGTVVLLHFWATWCRPCIKEFDRLEQIDQRFRAQKFKIVAVSLDARKKDVRRFISKKNLRFPIYMDSGRTVYQKMIGGTEVLPRSLLIDEHGQIVRTYVGAQHLAGLTSSSDIPALLTQRKHRETKRH